MEAAGKAQGAKADDVKPQAPAGEEDLSMEEILQSIRRIIAEDEKDGKKPADAKANGKKPENDVPGSDVFELTEMVKEDGSVESLKAKPPAVETKTASPDVLNKIDEALTPDKTPEKIMEKPPAAKPETKPAASAQDDIDAMFAAAPAAAAPAPAAAPLAAPAEPAPAAAAAVDSLLSTEAARATAESFKKLMKADDAAPAATATPAPSFRDGTTVEDLVTEMLRPMMKTWLDLNLPQIVERIVEREVKKLTR